MSFKKMDGEETQEFHGPVELSVVKRIYMPGALNYNIQFRVKIGVMMKKIPFMLMLVMPGFLGCEFTTGVNLLVADIISVSQNKNDKTVFSEGSLKVDIDSKESCEEKSKKIVRIISSYFHLKGTGSCSVEGEKTFFSIAIDVPFLAETKWNSSNELTAIIVKKDLKKIYFGVGISQSRFDQLSGKIKATFSQSIKIEDMTYSIRLLNDSGIGPVEGTVHSVFINGSPEPFESSFKIDPGKNAEIILSNVLRNKIYQDGIKYFGSIRFEGDVKLKPEKKNNTEEGGEKKGHENDTEEEGPKL